ncbi:multicopper oxidase family protein [Lentzea nigeriaca]|uniref:multicopper oxidase family protein n=1 Tax=Lentzea nigeriaca TaxID=1128665 RepID=UPI001959CEAF|nr:multicopper oxidase family protein [Lentzea nigeriaca]MBM7860705.1 FtsP/CotA-like multicopper oxidase with cupredoxin domain [Lentzea nigeriaca]
MATSNSPGRICRRSFLLLAATAGLTACASGGRVPPGSERVAEAERVRRLAGARSTSVTLVAATAEVDLGGVQVHTWAYGGQLPGREIRVRRGDVLKVELTNQLPEPTSIHWHGIALRNDMDGVPGLTQSDIGAGTTFTYEFAVPDAGTYFFHPHSGVQLDRGLYAPLIVEDPDDGADYDTELVIVLDDWLDGVDRTPDAVLDELKKNGMGGMPGMDHGSMPGMSMPKSELLGGDAGDVTYPHVLANGRTFRDPQAVEAKEGQRVRLRLINAAADTAFRVGVPGARLRVTHTDGFPSRPQEADVVLLGMGERLDAVVTVPAGSVPVLALAEGRDQYAQVVLRNPDVPAKPAEDAQVKQLVGLPVLMATSLRAADRVALPDKQPDVVHDLVLDGPGDKYTWTINGKVYDPNDGLPVEQGQHVRLKFDNKSRMFHPMHLHGHTFQVRADGNSGPRKDTVLVLPGRSVEVDFAADNPGQWLAHCHNVYHGEAGMMSVVSYVE